MDLSKKKLFLLDMDGTIYLDDFLFDGTEDFLKTVRQIGGRYLFLTNNSSRGLDAYLQKMERLGIPAEEKDFLTSSDATIRVLTQEFPGQKVYVMGTESLKDQLRKAGICVTDRLEDGIEVLLAGFDRELTFQKLEDACILLGRGVRFLATNPDWVCPTSYGYVPDCGSMCEMLWHATGLKPRVIGKPQPDMVYLALEKSGFQADEAVLIGDRLYTDIACGLNAGIDSVFVLSGEGKRSDIEEMNIRPTWVASDIKEILLELKRSYKL